MINIPSSTGGPGKSRSILLGLAYGVPSIVLASLELTGLYDVPFIDNPGDVFEAGVFALMAAFGIRHMGKRR